MDQKRMLLLIVLLLIFIGPIFMESGIIFATESGETRITSSENKEEKIPCVSHRPEEQPTCAAPPLPPHAIGGTGGIFITPVAYLPNPGQKGKVFGLPTFGVAYSSLGEKDFFSFSVTEILWGRIEVGYAFNNLQLGDLRSDIDRATGLELSDNHSELHHFNLRTNLIPEGGFGQPWMPAITLGIHYKYNAKEDDFNDSLAGTLRAIGVHDEDGVDYTLVGTKMITGLLPRPTLLTVGLRVTKACHIGLLGFSDDYKVLGEFSIVQFIADRILFSAEYRMKPDELAEIPGLVEEEDDWYALALSYIINNHSTVSFGWLHAGEVLNEKVDDGLAIRCMFEF